MSEFQQRRAQRRANPPPIGETVSPRAQPAPDTPPTATQILPATQISNRREIVGAQLVQVTSQDTTRRGLRFRNSGATTIYLGGPGVTNETASIRIIAGELWEEPLATAAQWWALSDAAAGVLNIEEIR